MFNVTYTGLDEAVAALSQSPNGLVKAVKSAVRRTLRGAKKDAGTKIKQRYTIAAGEVTKTIKLHQSGFSGAMTSSGSRNPLKKFNIRPRSRPRRMPPGGVFAQNVRGQGGQIYHAFLQRSGGVFERVSRARFPIRQLKGPSAPGMLGNPVVGPWIEAKMAQRLGINLEHELSAAMGGLFV